MEDIKKTGTSSYRRLQQENNNNQFGVADAIQNLSEDDLKNYLDSYLSPHTEKTISAGAANQYVQSDLLQKATNNNKTDYWGNSFFDDKIATDQDFSHLQDTRANKEPAALKLFNGIAKGTTLAGTTILDGTAGLIWGGIRAVGNIFDPNGRKGFLGGLSYLWDNEVSNALQDINKWSEELFPNYRTEEEENREWYKNLGTINWWADNFIKNMGFTVGAVYSGAAWIKGLKAVGLLKSAPVAQILGSVGSAVNEARVEANSLTREMKDAFDISGATGQIEAAYQTALQNLQLQYQQEYNQIMANTPEGLFPSGPEGSSFTNPRAEAIKALDSKYAALGQQLEQNKAKELKKAESDLYKAGFADFILNTALLSLGNFKVFGRIYSRGLEGAIENQLEDRVKREGSKYVLNELTKKRAIANGVVDGILEGNEELAQRGFSTYSKQQYMYDSPDSYYKALTDENARLENNDFLTAVSRGFYDSYASKDAMEEGAIGFLTGILGVPTFGKVNNSNSATWLGKNSKVGITGGLLGEIREATENNKQAKEAVDYINEWIDKKGEMSHPFIQSRVFTDAMEGFSKEANKFEFQNMQDNDDFTAISFFNKIGRSEDLKEFISKDFDNLSDQDFNQIINFFRTPEERERGKAVGLYDNEGNLTDKGKEELKKELKQKQEDILTNIKDYEESVQIARSIAQNALPESQVSELAWLHWKNKKFKDRYTKNKEGLTDGISKVTKALDGFIADINNEETNPLDLTTKEGKDIKTTAENLSAFFKTLSTIQDPTTLATILEASKEDLSRLLEVSENEDSDNVSFKTLFEDKLDMSTEDYDNFKESLLDTMRIAKASKDFSERFAEFKKDPLNIEKNRSIIDKAKDKVKSVVDKHNIKSSLSNKSVQEIVTLINDGALDLDDVNSKLNEFGDNDDIAKAIKEKIANAEEIIKKKKDILNSAAQKNKNGEMDDSTYNALSSILDKAEQVAETADDLTDLNLEIYNNPDNINLAEILSSLEGITDDYADLQQSILDSVREAVEDLNQEIEDAIQELTNLPTESIEDAIAEVPIEETGRDSVEKPRTVQETKEETDKRNEEKSPKKDSTGIVSTNVSELQKEYQHLAVMMGLNYQQDFPTFVDDVVSFVSDITSPEGVIEEGFRTGLISSQILKAIENLNDYQTIIKKLQSLDPNLASEFQYHIFIKVLDFYSKLKEASVQNTSQTKSSAEEDLFASADTIEVSTVEIEGINFDASEVPNNDKTVVQNSVEQDTNALQNLEDASAKNEVIRQWKSGIDRVPFTNIKGQVKGFHEYVLDLIDAVEKNDTKAIETCKSAFKQVYPIRGQAAYINDILTNPVKRDSIKKDMLKDKAIYDFLTSSAAFDRLDAGDVHPGQSIRFGVSNKVQQEFANIDENNTQVAIFMFDENNNVLGVLPKTNKTIQNLVQEEHKKWRESNTDSSAIFISDNLKSSVSQVLIGKVPYSNISERHSLNEIFNIGNSREQGFMIGINLRNGVTANPNDVNGTSNILQPLNASTGQPFLLLPTNTNTDKKGYITVPFTVAPYSKDDNYRINQIIEASLRAIQSAENQKDINNEVKKILDFINLQTSTRIKEGKTLTSLGLVIVKEANGTLAINMRPIGGDSNYKKVKCSPENFITTFKQMLEDCNASYKINRKYINTNYGNISYNSLIGEIAKTNLIPGYTHTISNWFTINPLDNKGEEKPIGKLSKDRVRTKGINPNTTSNTVKSLETNTRIPLANTDYYFNTTNNKLEDAEGKEITKSELQYLRHVGYGSSRGYNLLEPFETFTGEMYNPATRSTFIKENKADEELKEIKATENKDMPNEQVDLEVLKDKLEDKGYDLDVLDSLEKLGFDLRTLPLNSYDIELINDAIDENEDDEPLDQLVNKKIKELQNNKKDITRNRVVNNSKELIDIKKEVKWLQSVLPNLNNSDALKIVEGLIKCANSNKYAYGQFRNGIITIGTKAAKGTLYHEAFHSVVHTLMTDSEVKELFIKVASTYPNLVNPIDLEEQLAEDFRKYVEREEGLKGIFVKAFRKLKHLINTIFNNVQYLDNLYYNINNGKYAQRVQNLNKNVTRNQLSNSEKEMQQIKEQAIKDDTFMKAPNGNPTNLTERQWLLVRTKAFKNWFGNWENDPANASKVVDENGEPLVVYHGTNEENIQIFDRNKGKEHGTYTITNRLGSYFSDIKNESLGYANISWLQNKKEGKPTIYETYLNIRNPLYFDTVHDFRTYMMSDFEYNDEGDPISKIVIPKEYDGIYVKQVNQSNLAKELVIFNSNQVKSATDNNGEFSTEDNNIYYRLATENMSENTKLDQLSDIDARLGDYEWDIDERVRPYISIKNLRSLLEAVIKNSDDYLTKQAVKALLSYKGLGEISIKFDWREAKDRHGDFKDAFGVYFGEYNMIVLAGRQSVESLETTIVHEALHAITSRVYAINTDFSNKIDELFLKTLDALTLNNIDPDDYYGMDNPKEFMAEALANPEFIALLKQIAYPKSNYKSNIFKEFVRTITQFLQSLMGNDITSSYTLYNEVMNTIEKYARVVSDQEISQIKAQRQITIENNKIEERSKLEVVKSLQQQIQNKEAAIQAKKERFEQLVSELNTTYTFKYKTMNGIRFAQLQIGASKPVGYLYPGEAERAIPTKFKELLKVEETQGRYYIEKKNKKELGIELSRQTYEDRVELQQLKGALTKLTQNGIQLSMLDNPDFRRATSEYRNILEQRQREKNMYGFLSEEVKSYIADRKISIEEYKELSDSEKDVLQYCMF